MIFQNTNSINERGIEMNKTRKKRQKRSIQLNRLNQKKFDWQGIRIYECEFICEDCLNGNPTHNSFHFPHTAFEFTFNMSNEESIRWIKSIGCYNDSIHLVESWFPRQIKKGLNGLFNPDLSWTQLAISRCNELAR